MLLCTTIIIINVKMCWNKTLTFSVVQYNSVFIPVCSLNTCKGVFHPNVIIFQSNSAEGFHFSAFLFHYYGKYRWSNEAAEKAVTIK